MSEQDMAQTSHTWDHARYCDAIDAEIARFAAAVEAAAPALPIPTCPPWTLAELVKHAGAIHRRIERMVRERATQWLALGQAELGLPADEAGYAAWLAAGAAPLVATLRAASPDDPIWAWGTDQGVRFWSRRMLHETTVHRADAELALGREPAIDPAVAVDAVDEFLDLLPWATRSAPHVAELRGAGESLHFHCTDTAGEWLIRLGSGGFTWDHGHAKASVAVRGTATDLLLLVYGRRRPDEARYEQFGDSALLARWLEKTAI